MRKPGEVGDEVALGHLGQRQGLLPSMELRNEVFDWHLWYGGGSEGMRSAPDVRKLEEGGLLSPAHQWRTGGLAAGRRHQANAFSIAVTYASISSRVRRSVTATSNPSPLGA